jgi:hypothetical protein
MFVVDEIEQRRSLGLHAALHIPNSWLTAFSLPLEQHITSSV